MTIGERIRDEAESFVLTRYRLEISFPKKATLPRFLGSTLRGGFGTAFKKSVCVIRHRDCERCLIRQKCPYPYVFETPKPQEAKFMRRYDRIPHPYVLEPPLKTKPTYHKHDKLSFHLLLYGKAVELLPFFILTWEELSRKGLGPARALFRITEVKLAPPFPKRSRVYDSQSEKLIPDAAAKSITLATLSRHIKKQRRPITLSFSTPTRLQAGQRISERTFPFDKLIGSLLRRLSMISYFHCGQEIKTDYGQIVSQTQSVRWVSHTLTWQDFVRYSTRQKRKMNLGGLVGTITYSEEACDFYPLLWLGQWLHVGKNTSFGLGQYRIKNGT